MARATTAVLGRIALSRVTARPAPAAAGAAPAPPAARTSVTPPDALELPPTALQAVLAYLAVG